jgi:hypothetical protein
VHFLIALTPRPTGRPLRKPQQTADFHRALIGETVAASIMYFVGGTLR